MDKKQLMFKITCPKTKDISRFNVKLTSGINLHRVNSGSWFPCCSHTSLAKCCECEIDSQTVKNSLVIVPFKDLEDLNEEALNLIKSSDAILTSQTKDFKI